MGKKEVEAILKKYSGKIEKQVRSEKPLQTDFSSDYI
jgi:hypothetical protein